MKSTETPKLQESKKVTVKEEPSEDGEHINSESKNKTEDLFLAEGELAIDLYQTDKDIVIQSAIAGVKPEDLDISIENDMVTIRGVRRNPNGDEEKKYFLEECFWGPFSKQIFLPEEGDVKHAEAVIKDGVFMLRIPKRESQNIKKIQVKKGST